MAVAASCTTTAIDEVLASFTIASGILGVNSVLQIEPLWIFASSANNKVLKIKIGGTTVYSATRTTSVKEAPLFVLANRNSLASQIHPYDNNYVTAGSGAPVTSAINFADAQTVEITGQRTNSGDSLTLSITAYCILLEIRHDHLVCKARHKPLSQTQWHILFDRVGWLVCYCLVRWRRCWRYVIR